MTGRKGVLTEFPPPEPRHDEREVIMRWSRSAGNGRGEILRPASWAACLVLSSAVALVAQTVPEKTKAPPSPPRPPDVAEVRYGPHERNVLDLYVAKSDRPTPLVLFIHGGAWMVGDKNTVPSYLLDACAKAGITVATMNHRYASQAPYPAPFRDGARALQFLRLHAGDYNLNPAAVAVMGGSSGADIALWIGFHDDLADPGSDDPVARQTTRVSCVCARDAQTSLDPRVVDKLQNKKCVLDVPFSKLYGLRLDEMDTERAQRLYDDATAITHLTRDDPPVYLYYGFANKPFSPETSFAERAHHPAFGFYLKGRMDKVGVECVLRLGEDYRDKGKDAPVQVHRDMVQFFLEHFPKD
jgi:hypothetical protein